LTAEQLQAARAAHWRQKQNPILTLEDAENWLAQHPLCLFLPRRSQLATPAPSFVEACLGGAQATPDGAAIERAHALLSRLTAAGSVVPLNLLGAVSEQPDFLAYPEALPFVICLRADGDWKHAPQRLSGHRVSPLVLELWKFLDKDGGLTGEEARTALGREVTEAAVLRALCELWQGLRISPVFGATGEAARWELLRIRHRDALSTAAATGQVTALSLLVSMYLQSVYAATSEEIEIFLSPLASRSRVREAVRGLSATRQILSLSMDAQTYFFLEGGLPEFAELPAGSAATIEPVMRTEEADRPKFPPRFPQAPTIKENRQRRQERTAGTFRPPVPSSARRENAAGNPRPTRRRPEPPPARPAGWKSPQRASAPWQTGPAGPGSPRERVPGKSFRDRQNRPSPSRPTGGQDRRGPRPAGKPFPDRSGLQKPDRRAPWSRPDKKSEFAARPPQPGWRKDSPFRSEKRTDRGPKKNMEAGSERQPGIAQGRSAPQRSRPEGGGSFFRGRQGDRRGMRREGYSDKSPASGNYPPRGKGKYPVREEGKERRPDQDLNRDKDRRGWASGSSKPGRASRPGEERRSSGQPRSSSASLPGSRAPKRSQKPGDSRRDNRGPRAQGKRTGKPGPPGGFRGPRPPRRKPGA